jgi:hypothetical protein
MSFGIDETSEGVMADRGLKDDLYDSLKSFDLEIRLGWMLNHAEKRVPLP